MKRTVLYLVLTLALALPAADLLAEGDDRPLTPAEFAEFQAAVPGVEAGLNALVNNALQRNPTDAPPVRFQKRFIATKQSSSPTRAIRRAGDAMAAEIQAYLNSLAAEGWLAVGDPAPILKLKYKFGWSALKFYARISAELTLWCVKVP